MSDLEKQHALLPPSGASCWVNCGQYRSMLEKYGHIQEEGDAAREGTAAHWVWEQMARGQPLPPVGSHAPNGVEVTDEMHEGAELMQSVVGDASLGFVETSLAMPSVHPDNWGTPDYFEYAFSRVRVIDYKFGHGFVDPYENWQLIDYTCGIADRFELHGMDVPVELTIVQPRCFTHEGPVRKWVMNVRDLASYFERLRGSANGSDVARTGSHCDYCPGRAVCAALLAETQYVCDWATAELPLELPPASMGREYDRLIRASRALKARIGGIEEMIAHRIRTGASVDGWSLESAPGRQKWSKPIEEIIALGKLMGINLEKPGVVTPKQAIKAGLSEEMVSSVSDTPAGELKLVRVDVRRASRIFAAGA